MTIGRLLAAVISTTVGLAFWWGLTEPLPVPPLVLLVVPALILGSTGIVAGRSGVVAAPLALLFSLLLGSIIATQLHQAFNAGFAPVGRFGGSLLVLEWPALALPLLVAASIGGLGGLVGERVLPSLAEHQRRRRL
ncbi:MAG: hypothetical protein HY071_03975 [Chloroflexi bacterium]|nr:hypothetical protein [Chloroflexota bacterium]